MFNKKPKFFYKKTFFSTLLIPFSWIYFICFCFSTFRLFKPKKVCKKTICVGNIVVGGSGKTPISIALYEVFSKYYNNCCFITKGYGRKTEKPLVIPYQHNALFNTQETGDEAILLSQYGDVFIVNERKKANCKKYDLAICDDGYFDNSIHKDCKIAVFDGNFFIGNGRILPAGPLRSWMKSLRSADFIIITDVSEELYKQIDRLEKIKNIPNDKILFAKLAVKSHHDLSKTYFAFSGIGENTKFLKNMQKYGINPIKFIEFEDHMNYNQKILDKITKEFQASKADKIITTSKDFVKLPQEFCLKNNVEIFEITYQIDKIEKIVSFVKEKYCETNN